jgi:hypothetical protein
MTRYPSPRPRSTDQLLEDAERDADAAFHMRLKGLAEALAMCAHERALTVKRSPADLAGPRFSLVALTVWDGRHTWTVQRNGPRWDVRLLKSRGRPPRPGSLLRVTAMRESYKRALKEAQTLRRALKARRPLGEACAASPLGNAIQRSTMRGAPVVVLTLASGRRIPTDILWDDFVRGTFEPRALAEHAVGRLFGITANVVRKTLANGWRARRRKSAP